MMRISIWDGQPVTMIVCGSCGVGAGVTLYPDGPFEHIQKRLRDDLCDDCWHVAHRHAASARQGLPAQAMPAEAASL